MATVSISELREIALQMLAESAGGAPLDDISAALIDFGVKVSVTCLDQDAIAAAITRAMDAGATTAQIQEVLTLVSGLGVHSLMTSARTLLETAHQRGLMDSTAPLTASQQALWNKHVGDDPYWKTFEKAAPGFLDALLRLSPETFTAFFAYCAVPWNSGTVRPVLKELIAMATDAAPTHRFKPGFLLHLRNAMKLGAGRAAILQALDIATAAPLHHGVN